MFKLVYGLQKEVKIVIFIESSLLIAIFVSRCIFTYYTGFIFPDEATYAYNIVKSIIYGENYVIGYGTRYLYQLIMFVLSKIFFCIIGPGIFQYIVVSSLFSTLSSIGSIIFVYKILDKLGIEKVYTIISLILVPIFLIMSPFALTEPLSLFFVFAGLYFLVCSKSSFLYGSLSGMFFMCAVFVREPYIVMYLGNIYYMILRKGRRSVFGYFISGVLLGGLANYIYSLRNLINLTVTYPSNRSIQSLIIIYPSDESYRAIQSLSSVIIITLRNFVTGFLLSYGLISILIVVGFLLSLYYKKNELLLYEAFLGFLLVGASIAYQARFVSYFDLGFSFVDSVRQFHMSIVSILLVSIVYENLGKIFNKKYLLSLVVLISIVSLGVSLIYQESIDLSDISLSYRAPWIKIKQYTGEGHILIIGEPLLRLSLFNEGDNNVTIMFPMNETVFKIAISEYDHIFAYGEKHYNHIAAISDNFPWYYKMIRNETEYKVKYIWNDNESYLMEIVK